MNPNIQASIDAFEADYDYNMDYARELVGVDPELYLQFFEATKLAYYSGGLPPAAAFSVQILGTMAGDCGPCVQLGVKMAERAGVDAEVLRAVLAGEFSQLPEEVRTCVEFARALLRRSAELPEAREKVELRFGKEGLVAVAYKLMASNMYPTVKYALGHGHSCSPVLVAEQRAQVDRSQLVSVAV